MADEAPEVIPIPPSLAMLFAGACGCGDCVGTTKVCAALRLEEPLRPAVREIVRHLRAVLAAHPPCAAVLERLQPGDQRRVQSAAAMALAAGFAESILPGCVVLGAVAAKG